jgi:hypothetical protein
MDVVAGSGDDEFYTPLYAIKPIERYLPPPHKPYGVHSIHHRVYL